MHSNGNIVFKSKIGKISICISNGKIISLKITNKNLKSSDNFELLKAKKQILEYLKIKRKNFCLNISPNGTSFQKEVWKEISKIPYGKTTTYLNISNKINSSPRAVGQACAKNPILLIIPCHRVISKVNKLTGFSAIGGVDTKRQLLKIEHIII